MPPRDPSNRSDALAGKQQALRGLSAQASSTKEQAAGNRSLPAALNRKGNAAASAVAADDNAAIKLDEMPIAVSRRWYLTLSAVLGMAGAIVSSTYVVIDYGRIKPIEKELEDNRALLTSVKAEAQSAKSQLERAEQRVNALVANLDRPSPIFPLDRSSIIGSSVTFLWDYAKHDALANYILELQDLNSREPPFKINVDRPETRRLFYAFDRNASGSYAWRIRPGVMVDDREVAQGPVSPAALFSIHATVADRIRRTGKLLVATTPTSYDPSLGKNTRGGYNGFEFKLMRWLLPYIAKRLGLPLDPALEVVEVPWDRLFTYMQNGEADIAVRSITRSAAREREYQNLKFTAGYLVNHQMFVQSNQDGVYPSSLRGRIVGAKSRSINAAVATYLAQKYGFTVNASYTAYGDVLEGLRRGEITYAVVDSALVSEQLGRSVFALGSQLDDELGEFYRKELGFEREEYAILVHEGGSSELREALNDILQSPDYQEFFRSARLRSSTP